MLRKTNKELVKKRFHKHSNGFDSLSSTHMYGYTYVVTENLIHCWAII